MSEETVTPTEEGDVLETTPEPELEKAEQPEKAEEPEKAETPEPETEEQVKEDKKLAEMSYKNRVLARQNRQSEAKIAEMSEKLDNMFAMMQKQAQPNAPKLEEFESADEWLQASLKHFQQETPKEAPRKENGEYLAYVSDATDALVDAGSEKYEDFEKVVFGDVEITPIMRDTIFLMDNAPDVAYYLGKNPAEARKIAKLPPMRQAAEMGKIEAKLSQPRKTVKKPTAPEPVAPVGGSSTPSDEIQPVEDFESFKKKRDKQLGRRT